MNVRSDSPPVNLWLYHLGMHIQVVCAKCNVEMASTDSDDPSVIGALIVASHATNPHHTHQMKILVDDAEPGPTGPTDWRIRAVCTPCKATNLYVVPKELASGVVIMHHTGHEGHPIEVHVDTGDGSGERQIHPPPKL
jgi:hypothetical protein